MFSAAKKLNAAKPQPKSRGEDDVCQRMKNANGFFDGKCYISWNLSSVGEKDVQYPRQKLVVRNAQSFDIALQRTQMEKPPTAQADCLAAVGGVRSNRSVVRRLRRLLTVLPAGGTIA